MERISRCFSLVLWWRRSWSIQRLASGRVETCSAAKSAEALLPEVVKAGDKGFAALWPPGPAEFAGSRFNDRVWLLPDGRLAIAGPVDCVGILFRFRPATGTLELKLGAGFRSTAIVGSRFPFDTLHDAAPHPQGIAVSTEDGLAVRAGEGLGIELAPKLTKRFDFIAGRLRG